MSSKLYPLKFYPQFKEKIWGGRRLEKVLGKNLPESTLIGESWEISTVPDSVSIVANGRFKGKNLIELVDELKEDLLGQSVFQRFGNYFPLLVKYLDAQKDLSIQVHPNDILAKKRGFLNGKSEFWYVIEADPESSLVKGFNKDLDSTQFTELVNQNKLTEVLQVKKVFKNDVFDIPAGTIHNLGKGLLIAEIQQNSDVTYRIDDFNRTQTDGNKRELHIQESIEALNFRKEKVFNTPYKSVVNKPIQLIHSNLFIANLLQIEDKHIFQYPVSDSLRIFMGFSGEAEIKGDFESIPFKKGDTLLIPACIKEIHMETKESIRMLECQIPNN